MITKSKTLNELNLIDSFLFSSSTENIQDAEFIARLIEPNTYGKKNLPHRSRFYQSKVDSKNLNAGAPFTELPDFMSIWILSYDPFNENRMIYHVKNVIKENPDICYNDGTAKNAMLQMMN